MDGTIAYSPVVAVAASGVQATAATLSRYPNPVADRATIEWPSTAASAGCWSLATATGQVVHKEALRAEADLNMLAVDLLPYPSGSYVLTLAAAGQAVCRARVQKVNYTRREVDCDRSQQKVLNLLHERAVDGFGAPTVAAVAKATA